MNKFSLYIGTLSLLNFPARYVVYKKVYGFPYPTAQKVVAQISPLYIKRFLFLGHSPLYVMAQKISIYISYLNNFLQFWARATPKKNFSKKKQWPWAKVAI